MKSATLVILASLVFSPVCFAQDADFIAAAAARTLRSAQYKNVQISTLGNKVILTGSVALYATREDAEDEVAQIRGIGIVSNEIRVEAPPVPDRKLQRNLETAIAANLHRRLHSVHNFSHLLSVDVHSGVVTLEGNLPSMLLHHEVFEAVAHTKGVCEIIDYMQLGSNPVLGSVWADPGLGSAGDVQAIGGGTGIH